MLLTLELRQKIADRLIKSSNSCTLHIRLALADAFTDRTTIKKVPCLGGKAFEQGVGFLQIKDGKTL